MLENLAPFHEAHLVKHIIIGSDKPFTIVELIVVHEFEHHERLFLLRILIVHDGQFDDR